MLIGNIGLKARSYNSLVTAEGYTKEFDQYGKEVYTLTDTLDVYAKVETLSGYMANQYSEFGNVIAVKVTMRKIDFEPTIIIWQGNRIEVKSVIDTDNRGVEIVCTGYYGK